MKKNRMAKKNLIGKIWCVLFLVFILATLICIPAFATDPVPDTDTGGGDDEKPMTPDQAVALGFNRLDAVIEWIVTWVSKIGLVVAFFGGIQVALGFMNDDADSKVTGMKTLAAGFMVFGLCAAAGYFFLL